MSDEGMSFKPTNETQLRNGLLDDRLQIFKVEPVDESMGVVAFQFESGGLTMSFKRGMTMTEFADKLHETAERMRRYQRDGWPMYVADKH